MKLKELLDLAELKLARQYGTTRRRIPDRLELMAYMRHEINRIIEKENWNWAVTFLRPALQTKTGEREYLLPEDFRDNFLEGSKEGYAHAVHISNGSVDSDLIYEPPGTFFGRTQEGASNGLPNYYTVIDRAGRKAIVLDPPPDANSSSHYTIWGAYKMRFATDVNRQDSWNPVPNDDVVLYGTLLQVEENNDWRNRMNEGMRNLYLQEANKVQFVPAMGERRYAVSEFDPGRI